MFGGSPDEHNGCRNRSAQVPNRHGPFYWPVERLFHVYDQSRDGRGRGPARHLTTLRQAKRDAAMSRSMSPPSRNQSKKEISPMSTITISEDFSPIRLFLRNAAMTLAIAATVAIGSVNAQSSRGRVPQIKPGTNTSFGPLKQIDAGLLNVGYVEAGPADGPAVILLHGWPYDIYSYADVAPLLASAGYRVIVPYLRGYGTTRFLSSETFRNGQQSVVALDIIALMDALKIQKATIGGFDWGARSANIVAALWPERCKALVSVSGYLIGSQEAGKTPLPPKAELQWWYQFYFATERGQDGYGNTRMI